MKRIGIAVVLAAAASGAALAEQRSEPQQALAVATPDGTIQLTVAKTVAETVAKEAAMTVTVVKKVIVDEEVDGKVVKKEKEVQVPETRTYTYTQTVFKTVPETLQIDPQRTRYFEAGGRPVDPRTLAQRLTKPVLVVVTGDGKALPDYYAWAFKPNTLVVAMEPPAQSGPVPQPAGPALPPRAAPPGEASQSKAGPRARSLFEVSAEPEAPAEPKPAAKPDLPKPAPPKSVEAPKDAPALPLPPPEGPGRAETFPAAPAPQFQFAGMDRNGKLTIRRLAEYSFEKTAYREIEVVQDGEKTLQKVPFSMTVVTATGVTVKLDPRDVRLFTADSRPLDAARLPVMLAREQTAVVSTDGNPVDPFWLQNLNPWVVVALLPPEANAGAYGYGGHAPRTYLPAAPAGPARPIESAPPPPGT